MSIVKIDDLMAKRVITAEPHHTVDHVRKIFTNKRIRAVRSWVPG